MMLLKAYKLLTLADGARTINQPPQNTAIPKPTYASHHKRCRGDFCLIASQPKIPATAVNIKVNDLICPQTNWMTVPTPIATATSSTTSNA